MYKVRELEVRYKWIGKRRKKIVKFPKDAIDFFKELIEDLIDERMYSIFMNNQNEVMSVAMQGQGGPDSATIYPSKVARDSLLAGATAVILIHNHPSGNPSPSSEDRSITDEIKDILGKLQIRLLDHVIIGSPDKYFSFADEGII